MEKKFKARKKEICFVIFWHQSGKLIITKWKIIWSILSKTSISLLQFVIQINGCAPVLALQKRFHFQWCVKGILEKIIRNLKKRKLIFFFFGGGGGGNYKTFIFKNSPLDPNAVLRVLHRAVFISLYNYRASHNFYIWWCMCNTVLKK